MPDLRDYRAVHRAMTVDVARLAAAAADLVDRPDPARMAALRYYLRVVSAEIESTTTSRTRTSGRSWRRSRATGRRSCR